MMRTRRYGGGARARRGAVAPLALVAVLVLGTLATIGITARTTGLSFESRALGRVCARWAAEAAVAEVRGILSESKRAERVSGAVPAATGFSRATYSATVVASPGVQDVRAEGTCTSRDGRATVAVISVRFLLRANKWEVVTWSEGVADDAVAPSP